MNEEWQQALGQMTYGIYVLTTRSDDRFNGMIASWVTQVSYDPVLILAAIHPNRYSRTLLDNNGVFGLHVLKQTQKEMLKRFKGPDPEEKFFGISWNPGKTGVPILQDCAAWFELKVKDRLEPGNHTLFIGEVVDCAVRSSAMPLSTLDYEGMYTGKR
jgi:flavin reductase (DIM6/NTAB) family NADH-FMN oxidoreductase RutF